MRESSFTASMPVLLAAVFFCAILLARCDSSDVESGKTDTASSTALELGGTASCDTAAIIREYREKARARFKALHHDSDSPLYKLSPEDPESIFDIVFPDAPHTGDIDVKVPVDSVTYAGTLQISEKNSRVTPSEPKIFYIESTTSEGTSWEAGDYFEIEVLEGIDIAVVTNSPGRPFRDMQEEKLDGVRRHEVLGLSGVFTSSLPLRNDIPSYSDTIKLIVPGVYRFVARDLPIEEVRWEVNLAP